ncbi:hypothetical protein OPKNFCMD_4214 [Methylobacterium crusticola]|uniref:Uncharacterized protein n=1 Tax=Methylobacterium crusticola TaxID=1697972 RepID=A0ABQ4R3C7_9HYPH|nr:hypothetical protein [Methylobacterium crusticola]GJD51460.1 hypothetical protein OPKNFCMD_4214 [Methylobacterium crusticola]
MAVCDQAVAVLIAGLAPLSEPPSWVWVGLIGLLVGTVEIIARYRDDPWRAVRSGPALLYIAINVLIGLTMLACLRLIEPDWLFKDLATTPGKQKLFLVLAAGFGAVALFRSSLFKIKTVDGDLGIGPSIILDTLLFASDRAIDRDIAAPRGVAVAAIMSGVSFDRARIPLPAYCFALMQNVPPQEQKDLAEQVKDLAAVEMKPRIRALNLGLALMNVVGTGVLRQAVTDLKGFIGDDPALEEQDATRSAALLENLDFETAATSLPPLCFALCRTVPAGAVEQLHQQIDQLRAAGIDARVKGLILGLALADLVGYPVVKFAVDQLRPRLAADGAPVSPDDGPPDDGPPDGDPAGPAVPPAGSAPGPAGAAGHRDGSLPGAS